MSDGTKWSIESDSFQEYWVRGDHYNVGPAKGIESIEDARLIAAAHDLLAAARNAIDECCDLTETDAGRALEAAIAKADGR